MKFTDEQLVLFGILLISILFVYFRDKSLKERLEYVKKETPIRYWILLVGLVQVYIVPAVAFIEIYLRIFKVPKFFCNAAILLSSIIFLTSFVRLFIDIERRNKPTKP